MKVKKTVLLEMAWLIYLIFMLTFITIPSIQMISLIFIVSATLLLIPRENIRRSNLQGAKWYIWFFLFMTVSFIWSTYSNIGNDTYEAILRMVPVVICLDLYCATENDFNHMMNIFVVAITFFSAYVILMTPVMSYGTLAVGDVVGQQRNFIGQASALGSIIGFIYYVSTKKKIYAFPIGICYICACISGSRKAFLMLPFAIVIYGFLIKSVSKKIKYILVLVFIGIIFLFIFNKLTFFQDVFGERLLAIFDRTIEDKSIDGRSYLGEVAVQLFSQKPIIGWGFANVAGYLESIGYDHAVYAHNNYIELLANFGIVGCVIYYSYYIRCIVFVRKYDKENIYVRLIIILLCVCLFMEIGSVNYQKYFYIYLIVAVTSSLKWLKRSDVRLEGK